MIKKFMSVTAAFAIVAMFAFTGCQQREGQAPEKTAPTTTPTTPSSPEGK